MERRGCCVKNCGRSSHDHRGRKLPNGLAFHCFPAWRTNEGAHVSELTRRRRTAWVAAVNRRDVTFTCIPSFMRVCSRHFYSGRPAYEKLDSDPDWVPSLHLGHDGESTHTKHLLESECKKRTSPAVDSDSLPPSETEEDCVEHLSKAAEPSWREVKSMLQSLLKVRPNLSQKPGQEEHGGPVAETTDISFRDFFKGALEGALEASVRSTAQSKNGSSSEFKVKLNFEPLGGESVTSRGSCSRSSSSPSSCLNCVRLQRRIQELEQELFQLALDKTRVETDHEEDQVQHGLMEHRSPGEVALCTQLRCYDDDDDDDDDDDEVEGLDSRSSSSSPRGFTTRSESSTSSSPDVSDVVRHQRRSKLRFKEEWLSLFPFLRYSPSLNLMWCHVCRIHADVYHQNLALITGSRDFKKNSIEKHSNTNYHQESLRRHMLSSGASQL